MRQYHVYLAGPITGLSFNDCVNWRDDFINKMPDQIITFSALRGKSYLEYEQEIKMNYPDVLMSSDRGITTMDYHDVKNSDLLIANLTHADKVSIGTVMEIAWAKAFQIPVIMIIEKNGNVHDHPMIRDSTGYRVNNLEDAVWLTKLILLPAPHKNNKVRDLELNYSLQ